ncbi:hypothetical protein [Methylovirgula sp. 4M-Z18]|uniref:hypothetical protein n=1 Tax=Methylovirgula sp. 4M-Z18 TaxID=2293567 RepID=UPI000E2E504C|nr:hypothetical protein [Methylovirgula sp. 4M-Z18]RFB79285.1 hypothetical protein DYH55_11995 [Methylovirgula sp. 4M-Z18]
MRHSTIVTLALATGLALTLHANAATLKKHVVHHHRQAAPATKIEEDGTILRPSNVVSPDSLPSYTINSKDGVNDGIKSFDNNGRSDHNLPTPLNNPGEPRPLFTF